MKLMNERDGSDRADELVLCHALEKLRTREGLRAARLRAVAHGVAEPLLALSALTAVSQAEDALYSRRMTKRGIDAEGNYNICEHFFLKT